MAAACDLLDHGETERISGSQRSRLRARLRKIPVANLSYQILGDRVTLWRSTRPATGSPGESVDGLSATGSRLEVAVLQDAAGFARQTRLLEDADGDTLLVELDTDAPAVIEDIALYAYGDERTSSAARQRIVARQARLS